MEAKILCPRCLRVLAMGECKVEGYIHFMCKRCKSPSRLGESPEPHRPQVLVTEQPELLRRFAVSAHTH